MLSTLSPTSVEVVDDSIRSRRRTSSSTPATSSTLFESSIVLISDTCSVDELREVLVRRWRSPRACPRLRQRCSASVPRTSSASMPSGTCTQRVAVRTDDQVEQRRDLFGEFFRHRRAIGLVVRVPIVAQWSCRADRTRHRNSARYCSVLTQACRSIDDDTAHRAGRYGRLALVSFGRAWNAR